MDIGLIILYRLDSSLAIKQLIWNIAGFVFLTIIPFILQRMPRLDKYKNLYIIISFVMLVFAEMYGGGSGMGYFVKKNSELGVFANTWVGFIFMVIVLVVVMQIFEKVKEQLLKWTID